MMPRLKTVRCIQTKYGMFSKGTMNSREWWFVERRKDDAEHPAILPGLYRAKLGMFYSGDGVGGRPDYPSYVLQNVGANPPLHPAPYDQVKVHIANWARQLKACLAPGISLDYIGTELGVTASRRAYESFMLECNAAPELEIEILEDL